MIRLVDLDLEWPLENNVRQNFSAIIKAELE